MIRTLIAACAATLILAVAPAYAGDPINVCATKDGALRLSGSPSCKPGEKLMRFAEWEPDAPDADKDKPDADQPAASDQRIADLSARVAQLEASSQQQHPDKTEALGVQAVETKLTALTARVAAIDARAPDKAKVAEMANTIETEIHDLRTGLDGKFTHIANEIEKEIHDLSVRIDALAKAKDSATPVAANRVQAPFEVVGSGGQVILRVTDRDASDGGGAHVTIGPGSSGNYALRVFKGAEFIAGVGQSKDTGAGLVIVNDADGTASAMLNGTQRSLQVLNSSGEPTATVKAADHGGLVAILQGSTAVAYLTQSSAGDGGNVTVALNNGFGVFSAGAAQDGAGEACVNRKTQAGTPRVACLGLGLPSAGMGK